MLTGESMSLTHRESRGDIKVNSAQKFIIVQDLVFVSDSLVLFKLSSRMGLGFRLHQREYNDLNVVLSRNVPRSGFFAKERGGLGSNQHCEV